MKDLLLGKLDWHALPHEWFTIGGSLAFVAPAIGVVAFLSAGNGCGANG